MGKGEEDKGGGKKEKEGKRRKEGGNEKFRSIPLLLWSLLDTPILYRHKKYYFYITWFPIRCEHKGICSNPDTTHLLNVEIIFFFRIIYEMHMSIHLSLLFPFCFLLIMNLLGLT